MTQKIRIKLHAADGKKTHDWEFTFPAGTTQQHAQAVFDSLVTLSRYHPGTGKEIDRTNPSIIPSTKHTCYRADGEDFCAVCNQWTSNGPKTIHNHHSPTGSAPEAVKAKGSDSRHARTP